MEKSERGAVGKRRVGQMIAPHQAARLRSAGGAILFSRADSHVVLRRRCEVYPLKGLHERNRELEVLVEERTRALAQAGRRAGELVARYGGGEFVVVLPDTNRHDALETARHIQNQVWLLALPHAETSPGIVTVSLGVAGLVPSKQRIHEDLVRQADSALYRAKQSGRNCLQSATD